MSDQRCRTVQKYGGPGSNVVGISYPAPPPRLVGIGLTGLPKTVPQPPYSYSGISADDKIEWKVKGNN